MANELATSKDITNYLKHVFDLEKMLYQQNEILEHLRDSIGSVNYQMKLEPEIYQEKRPSVGGGIILGVAKVVQTQSYNQQVRITNQENIEGIQRYRKNLLEKGKTLNDEYALLADERKKTKAVLNKKRQDSG